jgi:hypothetical protein
MILQILIYLKPKSVLGIHMFMGCYSLIGHLYLIGEWLCVDQKTNII